MVWGDCSACYLELRLPFSLFGCSPRISKSLEALHTLTYSQTSLRAGRFISPVLLSPRIDASNVSDDLRFGELQHAHIRHLPLLLSTTQWKTDMTDHEQPSTGPRERATMPQLPHRTTNMGNETALSAPGDGSERVSSSLWRPRAWKEAWRSYSKEERVRRPRAVQGYKRRWSFYDDGMKADHTLLSI